MSLQTIFRLNCDNCQKEIHWNNGFDIFVRHPLDPSEIHNLDGPPIFHVYIGKKEQRGLRISTFVHEHENTIINEGGKISDMNYNLGYIKNACCKECMSKIINKYIGEK